MILAAVNESLSLKMIEEAALRERKDILTLADEETLWAAIQEETPEVLLLEIGISTLDGPGFIQKLKQNPSTREIPIVAFGNSLRADLLQDARESGADLILPMAAFREQICELIRHYSKPAS